MKTGLQVTFLACILLACNATKVVRPLSQKETIIGATFGGAVIQLGSAVTPLPLTSIYAAHGIKNNLTVFAGLHTTSLAFGVFQTDVGICRSLLTPKKWVPGLSTNIIANFMLDRWEKKASFYPQIDINAYWPYGKKQHFVYISLNNWFELRQVKAHQEAQTVHWLPSFGFGHQWQGKKLNWQAEFKYVGFNQSNQNIVVDYVSWNNKGALGLYIGVAKKF